MGMIRSPMTKLPAEVLGGPFVADRTCGTPGMSLDFMPLRPKADSGEACQVL